MSQQMEREMKRKVDELNENDEQPPIDKTAENPLKKVKSPDKEEAKSSNDDMPAEVIDQGITLITGGIYRVQCPELGDFHIRAGATGSFCVKAASLIISNNQETVFPDPALTLMDGAEVEVKDNLSGVTSLTVLPSDRQKPPPQNQNWLATIFNEVILGTPAVPPLQIVGLADKDLIVTGGRDVVIIGSGGRLAFSGTGAVTVQGSLQTLQNNGVGRVEVIGSVTEEVRQTGSGSTVIIDDVTGSITNTGGGSVEVKGMHKGDNKQLNNTRGAVWIGTGPNNEGVKEYYYTKNYKIIQL